MRKLIEALRPRRIDRGTRQSRRTAVWHLRRRPVLLADRIADGDEPVLRLLDITVQRNGYGRQLDSFEADVAIPTLGAAPMHGVFIRAPVISELGPEVEVLASDADGRPIAGAPGRVLATAFHPGADPGSAAASAPA